MSSVMSKKVWEHSGHARRDSSCLAEKLLAVTFLSRSTGRFRVGGVAGGLVCD